MRRSFAVSVLILSVICFQAAFAAIGEYDGEELETNEYFSDMYGMYTPNEAPYAHKHDEAMVSLDLHFTATEIGGDEPLKTEVLLFHHDMKEQVGKKIGNKWYLCCYQNLFEEGHCNSVGNVILTDEYKERYYTSKRPILGYYWNIQWYYSSPSGILSLKEHTTLQSKVELQKSGMWRLWIVQCGETEDSEGAEIVIDGKTIFRNPYGHLPGEIAPLMPLYYLLAIGYLLLGVFWFLSSVIYRQDLMKLQHCIAVVIFLGFLENILAAADWTNYNTTGHISLAFNVITFLVSVFKMTISFVCLLLVTIGYTVIKPKLAKKEKSLVVSLGIVYFIVSFLYKLFSTLRYTPQTQHLHVSYGAELVFLIPTTILNFLFLFFIYRYLFTAVKTLAAEKQSQKYRMFKILAIVLAFFYIFSFLFFLLQLIAIWADTMDDWWRGWFIFTGYWSILHLAVALPVCILWRPSNNNRRYAYSVQLDDNHFVELEENGAKSPRNETYSTSTTADESTKDENFSIE